MLKSEIQKVYELQNEHLSLNKRTTQRDYLTKLNYNHKHIEVITGIRRCGKSTFMSQIMKKYKNNLAYMNFEDSRLFVFQNTDFLKLDEVIGYGKSAYFFDEIQNILGWEIFIRQLHERGDKVYITGSNATLMSRELGTRLTGRYISHELFPFSYTEFLAYKNNEQTLNSYIKDGGFPEYLNYKNEEILQTLLKDIIYRDIAVRYNLRNVKLLMDLALYMLSNVGKEFTYNGLKKIFMVPSGNTISDYLSWLSDSYLLFFLPKFSWSPKSISINSRKIYAIDTGMVNCNSLSFSKDSGRLFENIIFLHLRKNYSTLFYFREHNECDFVVFEKNKCKYLIQVCEKLHNENELREINGLTEAMKFFNMDEGMIVTKNQNDELIIDKMKVKIVSADRYINASPHI